MKATATLRRYTLPSVKGEGWAIIVIGSDGYFSSVSDWGNYAFIWSDWGDRDFRKFLIGLDASYFWSKITHMRQAEVWDEERVEKNIRERLDEFVKAGRMSQRAADLAFDECEGNVGSDAALYAWAAEVSLPEDFCLYEGIGAMKPEGWSWGFATKVLPRFQSLLRDELAREAESNTIDLKEKSE